jgi:AmiR/NasT family two-component response regulator
MPDVLTYARDMLFTSKIREVARQLGVSVTAIRATEAGTPPAELDGQTRLVILDLRLPGALELLGAIRGSATRHDVPTVGFIDHENTAVMDQARALGCTEVMTKGQFSHALPRLLKFEA